jgi:dipeptidyl aminopeptidase/acylaminoacyl peptidase
LKCKKNPKRKKKNPDNFFVSLSCRILFSNGKPGETAVVDEFRIDWGTYMSSHNDVIYIRLDVRGAKGQGKTKLYRHLGGVEVDDQIAAIE